jgi:hypothetical protein
MWLIQPVSEQSSHLCDHPGTYPFRLYVNFSHWMLRVPINLGHAGQHNSTEHSIRLLPGLALPGWCGVARHRLYHDRLQLVGL